MSVLSNPESSIHRQICVVYALIGSYLFTDHLNSSQGHLDSCLRNGIFAGTKITPEALEQTLKFEPQDVPAPAPRGNACPLVHLNWTNTL